MKKYIIIVILSIMLCLPFSVMAKEKVNVYFFHGDGCPHCEEADTFLNSLPVEEQAKINVIKYEVWYDEDNSTLMKNVSSIMHDNANGVPYIIIGDKSWIGYSNYLDELIIKQIDTVYNQDENDRYDVMDEYEKVKDELLIDNDTDYNTTDSYDDDDFDGDIEEYINSYIPSALITGGFLLLGLGILVLVVTIVIIIIVIIVVTKKKK